MIEKTVESLPSGSFWKGLLLALAAALLPVSAITLSPLWALSAVPFLSTAFTLGCIRWRPFHAVFTETGIELSDPPVVIPYSSVQGLQAPRPTNPYVAGRRAYPIRVLHAKGIVDIPPRLNIPSDEVYSFLYHHLTSSASPEVQPSLRGYLRRQVQRYGSERVWSYDRRAYTGGKVPNLPVQRLSLVLFLTGLIWVAGTMLIIALFGDKAGEFDAYLLCPGFLILPVGGTLSVMLPLKNRPYKTDYKKRHSSIIVCPSGLALCQGDLVGELRWDEVRRIRAAAQTITLTVAGAEIVLHDVYDRPLVVIHQVIMHYYKGDHAPNRADWHFDASRFRDLKDQATLSDSYYRDQEADR